MPIKRKLTNLEKNYFAQKAKEEKAAKEKAEKEKAARSAAAAASAKVNAANASSSSKTPGKAAASASSIAPVLLQERTGKPPKNAHGKNAKEVEMKDAYGISAASGSKTFAKGDSRNNDADVPRAGAKRRVLSEEPADKGTPGSAGRAKRVKKVRVDEH